MKKTVLTACILSLICSAMLTMAVSAIGDDFILDVGDLFPFSMRTTAEGTEFTTVMENIPSGSVVIAAAYQNGRLVETKIIDASGSTYSFTKEYDSVKVFAFGSAETLKPIAKAETVAIN